MSLQREPEQRTPQDWLPPLPWSIQRARCFTWAEKLALLVLWGRAHADGTCFTSLAELAADMPASLSLARAAVHGLRDKGVLSLVQTGRGYDFTVSPPAAVAYVTATSPIRIDRASELRPTSIDRAQPTSPIKNDSSDLSELTGRPTDSGSSDLSELIPKEKPEEKPSKKSPKAEAPIASPPATPPDPRVTSTRQALEKLRGGPFPFPARENKVIKALLREYDTYEIVACWLETAATPFYQSPGRALTLNTVAGGMAAYRERQRTTPPRSEPEPVPTPAGPRERYGRTVPEITAPPGVLWERTLDRLAASGMTRSNVELARSAARCLGWSGDELVVAVADRNFRPMERAVETALSAELGARPAVLYVWEPTL